MRSVHLLVFLAVVPVVNTVEVVPKALAAVGTCEALLMIGVGSGKDRL